MAEKQSIFKQKKFVVLFAVVATLAWGGAYPFIKLGISEFQIANEDISGKVLFAGIRFFLAGAFVLAGCIASGHSIKVEERKNTFLLLLFGLVNTALHYCFFYIGLSNCDGGKASIIDSLGTFWLIFLACIFFREKLTVGKIAGCILGFLGILTVNIGSGGSASFSLDGEGMLLLNTVCSAFGGVLTRVVTKRVQTVVATGYSLLYGGMMLIVFGYISGGRLERITLKGMGILAVLIAISIVGFLLYNQLLKCNPVGEIAIFNALIPVFGTLLCCLLLGEEFKIKYVLAIALISSGIYAINRKNKNAEMI